MLAIFFERRKPLSNLWSALLPVVYLLGVTLLDHFIPGPPVLQSLCIIGVMLMALFLPTLWVAIWALVYIGVIWGLYHSPDFYYFTGQTRELPHQIGLDIRAFSFTCMGLFAVSFSHLFNAHRKSLRELREVMARFPEPIVISDFSGAIIDCNNMVTKQLGVAKHHIRGMSYFDCFSSPEFKGRTIAKYLALFEGAEKKATLKLCMGNHNYIGETVILESSGSKYLLTVFTHPGMISSEVELSAK